MMQKLRSGETNEGRMGRIAASAIGKQRWWKSALG